MLSVRAAVRLYGDHWYIPARDIPFSAHDLPRDRCPGIDDWFMMYFMTKRRADGWSDAERRAYVLGKAAPTPAEWPL